MMVSEKKFFAELLALAVDINGSDDRLVINMAINDLRLLYRGQFEGYLENSEKYEKLINTPLPEITEWYAKHLDKRVAEFDEYDLHIAKSIKKYLEDHG